MRLRVYFHRSGGRGLQGFSPLAVTGVSLLRGVRVGKRTPTKVRLKREVEVWRTDLFGRSHSRVAITGVTTLQKGLSTLWGDPSCRVFMGSPELTIGKGTVLRNSLSYEVQGSSIVGGHRVVKGQGRTPFETHKEG